MERRMSMRPLRAAGLSLLGMLMLAACSDDRETYSQSADGYLLAMRLAPNPPEAGKTAVVTAVLHLDGHASLATCPVKFRQYPAGQPPAANDETGYHAMRQDLTSDIYRADSDDFGGVGKWIIEFKVACDKDVFNLRFPIFTVKPQ